MNMVEKIARAICEAEGELPEALDPLDISGKRLQMWRRYVPHAVAALEALREPTPDAMISTASTTRWSAIAVSHALSVER